jgi:uncharacterized membrane protein YhhN
LILNKSLELKNALKQVDDILFIDDIIEIKISNKNYSFLIFFQLKAAMGGLIYPILVYMALICSAALMAIHAGGNLKASLISKLFWFPGMLFFISSDTVLAFNKFSWEKSGLHIQNIGLVTMLTYGIAQLLLVKGFQLYFKQQAAAQE